jgi:hypothetical protein
METVRRLRRVYVPCREQDIFLRAGFRVANTAGRLRLNQLAADVLAGMTAVENHSLKEALDACAGMEPKRAIGHWFGIAAASELLAQKTPTNRPSQWSFVFGVGKGFGRGRWKAKKRERNAVLTGRGMYSAYWHWRQYVEEQSRVIACPAADRGLGMMIWLGSGADAPTAASIAHSFALERQPEIWKGIGFALCFLAGISRGKAESAGPLLEAAGPMSQSLTEGVAFGAFQRNLIQDMDELVEGICRQMSADSAASLIKSWQAGFPDWE